MARLKKDHVHKEQAEEQPLPDNVVELQDMADDLWQKYFDKDALYSSDRKREIKEQYNTVANKINSIKGDGFIRTIKDGTEFRFPDDLDDVQCDPLLEEALDKNVYKESKVASVPKRGKKKDTIQVAKGSGSKMVPVDSKEGQAEIKRREQFKADNPDSVAANAAPIKSAKKEGGKSIIEQILELHDQGLSNKEIVARGYNKSTVNRQVGEYKKRKEALKDGK